MKLKTLLAMMLVLVATVFAIACNGGDDTTATPGTDAPGGTTAATTTKATTTKVTTTKKTTVTTTRATTLPREITFEIPAKLPNGKAYNSVLVFDGTEESAAVVKTKDGGTYDIFTKADGNKVFAYHITKDWMEATVAFDPYFFSGEEDGMLFYADISQTKADELACIGPRITVYGSAYQAGSHNNSIERQGDAVEHNHAYYLADGAVDWVQTFNYSNCRVAVPSQFKGWLYLPFDQLSQSGNNIETLANFIASYPGECDLTQVEFYTGHVAPPEGAGTVDCYFDNFIVVTEK